MIKEYTILMSGHKDGSFVSFMFGSRGFNKDDALQSLYRSCVVDPFVDYDHIVVTERTNVK